MGPRRLVPSCRSSSTLAFWCTASIAAFPDEALFRLALRGAATYELEWFDAHLWAYAEYYGLDELLSEDFQHDRLYGRVRAVNPFR
jgi:predicted nucleic acid-binding protein